MSGFLDSMLPFLIFPNSHENVVHIVCGLRPLRVGISGGPSPEEVLSFPRRFDITFLSLLLAAA